MVHLLKELQRYEIQKQASGAASVAKDEPVEIDQYETGQMVKHIHEGYRGIIVDYDLYGAHIREVPQGEDNEPDRNQPWYQVLIHDTDESVYVAHSLLIQDVSRETFRHPLLSQFFSSHESGVYVRNHLPWLD